MLLPNGVAFAFNPQNETAYSILLGEVFHEFLIGKIVLCGKYSPV
jgi:hypothetical protein